MSLLTTSNEQSFKEEIFELANALADTQARLFQLAKRMEANDPDVQWRQRVEELQAAHKEAVNSAKWLRAQNVELENRLERHKPEVNNAVEARNLAFQKLKHARKVIRDLLAERSDMSSPRGNGGLNQREIEEALGEELSASDDSSSDSEKTVRMGANTPFSPSHSPERPDFSLLASLSTSPARSRRVSPARSAASGSINSPRSKFFSPVSEHSSSFVSSIEVLLRAQSPTGSQTSPEPLRIHFKNPPGVSVLQHGPISLTKLGSGLMLDEDKMNSLSCLSSSTDVSMRLEIFEIAQRRIVACVYDPILVDLPGRSFLLDWGGSQVNRNLEKYIFKHKAVNTVFHTFLFPPTEDNWFYVGALQWARVQNTENQIADVWLRLDEKNKKKIVKKLCKRTKGEVQEDEMAKLLDNGDLQQLCIELKAVGDGQVSHAFATEVLGRQASPYSPSRHERRAEGVKE